MLHNGKCEAQRPAGSLPGAPAVCAVSRLSSRLSSGCGEKSSLHLFLRVSISYSLFHCDRKPDKGNLSEEGFVLAGSITKIAFPQGGKVWSSPPAQFVEYLVQVWAVQEA